jgi:hypothetical protein
MIINDLFNNKKFVAEEESEAESERRRYPNYYQHKDRGTVFKVQSPDGKTKTVPPDDEKWDDYYQKKFKGMPTPNDGGFWNDDDTAAMVEGSAGQVVFLGTGADGGTYEIIQSSPTDFMIHANGKHIDTYGSLQRAMSVLKNEVPGLQQGMAEGSELKQAKRKYNQAAKDANLDQVGAGKKIDTMKKSLRQKDVDNKKQGVAEGWRDIYNLNKQKIGTNPNLIKPDTVLKMPDGNRYIVKPGDTLSSIAKTLGAKSVQSSTPPKVAAEPKYYTLPPGAAAAVKPAPVKPAGTQDASPYTFDMRSNKMVVKPEGIADVFQNTQLPPPLTRDEIEQQMMQPDFGGPNAPGYKHTVQGAEGEEYEFDSGQEAKDFVDRIEQLRLRDRALGGLGAAKSESISSKKKGMAEDDGFNVVSNYQNMHTTDTGNKSNQTYTSTAIAKNPATGQQKSMASWDYTDPKTGKNYSGSNYIDPQGNAEVQKNYEESQDQLDELDKKTVASWVRQQPQRIKGASGLSRTDFKKAKRLVDKSIPSAIAKYKDPSYGKQEPRLDEVSLGDYRKKATVNKALAQTNKFFGRDDPAKVAAADQTIAKRERGLSRADARGRPYTAPPVDQDKQRRDLADKYPNIDELVRQAELRRDPQYDRADGQAYYNGRDAEHNYHRLKQIQRMIRGAELDEMDFGGVSQTTDSDTGDITTSFNQGPMSVTQTKTPGGYTKQTDRQFNLGTATMGVKTAGPNIGAGQLAGTTTATATNNQTGQTKQQVRGVGFGGATGPNVGKNYVGATNDELAKHAADSFMGTNENIDRMKHLAGVKSIR